MDVTTGIAPPLLQNYSTVVAMKNNKETSKSLHQFKSERKMFAQPIIV